MDSDHAPKPTLLMAILPIPLASPVLQYDSCKNLALVALTGSGKSIHYVIPNLLGLSRPVLRNLKRQITLF